MLPRHELRVLAYVVHVADKGSVSAAARELGVGQPTMSRQIVALERSLGVRLFDRAAGGVAPTSAGRAFVVRARRALAEATALEADMLLLSQGLAGSLSVAFAASAINGPLAPALKMLRSELPRVDLVLHELFDDVEMAEGVRSGRYDIAVHRLPLRDPALRTTPWARENLSLFLPDHHPLIALDDPLPLEVLRGLPLVMWDRRDSPRAFDEIMAIYHRIDSSPNTSVTAHSAQSILALVSAGFGAAIMTDSYRNLRRVGVSARPLAGLTTTIHLSTQASASTPHVMRAIALMQHMIRT